MKYRMIKVEKGEQVWFETEYRSFFIWRPCFVKTSLRFPAQYATWNDAAESIDRHRRLHQIAKRTVVRNY